MRATAPLRDERPRRRPATREPTRPTARRGASGRRGRRAAIGRLADEILPPLIARFRAERPRRARGPRATAGASGCAATARCAERATATAPTRPPSRGAAAQGSATPRWRSSTGIGVGPGRRRRPARRPRRGRRSSPLARRRLLRAARRHRDGRQVRSGDVLGHVDVLGVRQEVVGAGRRHRRRARWPRPARRSSTARTSSAWSRVARPIRPGEA